MPFDNTCKYRYSCGLDFCLHLECSVREPVVGGNYLGKEFITKNYHRPIKTDSIALIAHNVLASGSDNVEDYRKAIKQILEIAK